MRQQITTPIVRRLVGRNHAHRFAFYGQTSGFASNHRGQGLLGEGVLFSGALLLLGSGFCGRLRCRNPGVAISAQFFFSYFFSYFCLELIYLRLHSGFYIRHVRRSGLASLSRTGPRLATAPVPSERILGQTNECQPIRCRRDVLYSDGVHTCS